MELDDDSIAMSERAVSVSLENVSQGSNSLDYNGMIE